MYCSTQYTISVAVVEIYNENVFDLLVVLNATRVLEILGKVNLAVRSVSWPCSRLEACLALARARIV